MFWIAFISDMEYEQFLAMGYPSDEGVPEEADPIGPPSLADDQLPIQDRVHPPAPTQGVSAEQEKPPQAPATGTKLSPAMVPSDLLDFSFKFCIQCC